MKNVYQWPFDGKNSFELQWGNLDYNQTFNSHDTIMKVMSV